MEPPFSCTSSSTQNMTRNLLQQPKRLLLPLFPIQYATWCKCLDNQHAWAYCETLWSDDRHETTRTTTQAGYSGNIEQLQDHDQPEQSYYDSIQQFGVINHGSTATFNMLTTMKLQMVTKIAATLQQLQQTLDKLVLMINQVRHMPHQH